ncbi:hypothetical protein L7F22_044189 [Adiantum nelumboides]|nr:hypothetical protein [Adiantum nelumboides]
MLSCILDSFPRKELMFAQLHEELVRIQVRLVSLTFFKAEITDTLPFQPIRNLISTIAVKPPANDGDGLDEKPEIDSGTFGLLFDFFLTPKRKEDITSFVKLLLTLASADGSNNNPLQPRLGAAGEPYSRTTSPMHTKGPYMPAPELVFEQLLRRREFTPHKSGLNRFFFSFANMVIHEIFRTDHKNQHINLTSSYVDLSVIYGDNQDEQDKVRTHEQGRIWPDTFSSARVMMMSPGIIAVAIMFSRHHNYLAQRLFEVNETGKYKPWDSLETEGERKWQDNDIFQLARNINVAFFAKSVLTDYVSAILDTVRANSDWHLELGKEIRDVQKSRVERGVGNSVSCEFNVLYHWHAVLPLSDEKWMIEQFERFYPGVPPEKITPEQFYAMAGRLGEEVEKTDPNARTFSNFKRGEDGSFDDTQLGNLIKDCIEETGHSFGARSTPASFKAIEIAGLLQARNVFQVGTMNEFREYLYLKKFNSFLEWNPDPAIAHAAEKLYGHIDNLELYPGLMAEETIPQVPGSGLQPGHTIGRGILADAISLVRGDRFLTYDLNASTLTNWGLAQVQSAAGAYGGHLAHVLYRGLPNAWGSGNSTYSLLPFYIPVAARMILHDNGTLSKYDNTRPLPHNDLHVLKSRLAVEKALGDPMTFAADTTNLDIVTGLARNRNSLLLLEPAARAIQKAFFEPGFDANVIEYFGQITRQKIQECSLRVDTTSTSKQLDVIKDIINVVPIYWISGKVGIPLKTTETPLRLVTVFDLHNTLLTLAKFVSGVYTPEDAFGLREAAVKQSGHIRRILEHRYLTSSGARALVTNILTRGTQYELSQYAKNVYASLHSDGVSMHQAIAGLFAIILPATVELTTQTGLLLELFLDPAYDEVLKKLVELANREDKAARKEFVFWINEGIRLRPATPGVLRKATENTTIRDGENAVKIKKGEHVLLATSLANLDPDAFPDPTRLGPYVDQIEDGLQSESSQSPVLLSAIVTMLKEVFKLPNIRKVKGISGTVIGVSDTIDGVKVHKYVGSNSKEVQGPVSLVAEFDM